jgi:hypothetical protein
VRCSQVLLASGEAACASRITTGSAGLKEARQARKCVPPRHAHPTMQRPPQSRLRTWGMRRAGRHGARCCLSGFRGTQAAAGGRRSTPQA